MNKDEIKEQLNTELYDKMRKEYNAYKAKLFAMSTAEILDHAYEYVCRENIILALEINDLPTHLATILLETQNPLDTIFQKWDMEKSDQQVSEMFEFVKKFASDIFVKE